MNYKKKARHCERSEAIWELQSRSQSDRETMRHQIAAKPSAPHNNDLSFIFSDLRIKFIKSNVRNSTFLPRVREDDACVETR